MHAATVLSIAGRVCVQCAHIISWPIAKCINAIIIFLLPLYNMTTFALLPVIHLGHAITRVLSIPFTVKWLEQIETVYVFLGTAGLIGCLTGAILFIITKFLSTTLNIHTPMVPAHRQEGRTTADFRAARRVKNKKETIDPSPSPTPVVLRKVAGPCRRGLLSQAIIEEEESDF